MTTIASEGFLSLRVLIIMSAPFVRSDYNERFAQKTRAMGLRIIKYIHCVLRSLELKK